MNNVWIMAIKEHMSIRMNDKHTIIAKGWIAMNSGSEKELSATCI